MSALNSISIDDTGAQKTGDEKLLLHEAARKYDCLQVKTLLDRGWDPNIKDVKGRTVLHVLLNDGFLGHLYEANMEECVKSVLGKCDPNVKDGYGETPLSLAVSNGFESCAIWLVQHGAETSVRTSVCKRMHSLPSKIAQTMPNVMMEILNSGVTLDYVTKSENGSGEPEVKVKLDWSPVLQFCEESDKKNEKKLRRHKYKQREMSFLYSLVDVPPNTRNMLLNHPLVSAFMHIKSTTVSKRLRWFQMLLSTYPVFYMIFIYFLYFNHCKFKENNEPEDESNKQQTNTTSQMQMEESTSRKQEQLCEITWSISVAAYLLFAVVGGFVLVEIFMQLRVDTRYLRSWRTWVFRVSLLVMALTLWPALQFNTVYNITWQYPIAAMGTFFAWVMFLIQMELIPQVKIYLEMLVSIILSVLKITLLFLPLLAGFYMGFNLMFFEIGGIMNFILMTVDVGSDEYEEMIENAKDSRAWFTIIAYAFSIAFIVVIAIVFMNFLLGVSINDIQELKHNAKIMALSNQIQRLFIIDLVFPTRYNVVPEGAKKCSFSYGPYDGTWRLPKDIRTQITLLLKSKYSTRQRIDNDDSKSEPFNITNSGFSSGRQNAIDGELVKRIEKLESKLHSITEQIRTDL